MLATMVPSGLGVRPEQGCDGHLEGWNLSTGRSPLSEVVPKRSGCDRSQVSTCRPLTVRHQCGLHQQKLRLLCAKTIQLENFTPLVVCTECRTGMSWRARCVALRALVSHDEVR